MGTTDMGTTDMATVDPISLSGDGFGSFGCFCGWPPAARGWSSAWPWGPCGGAWDLCHLPRWARCSWHWQPDGALVWPQVPQALHPWMAHSGQAIWKELSLQVWDFWAFDSAASCLDSLMLLFYVSNYAAALFEGLAWLCMYTFVLLYPVASGPA